MHKRMSLYGRLYIFTNYSVLVGKNSKYVHHIKEQKKYYIECIIVIAMVIENIVELNKEVNDG